MEKSNRKQLYKKTVDECCQNDCKNCQELIKRYGYCQVVEDWVAPAINKFSWEVPEDPRLFKRFLKKLLFLCVNKPHKHL